MSDTELSVVTAGELPQLIERAEQFASEKADIAEQEKKLFAEARGRGYDVKVMRKIIRDRKMSRDALVEFENIEELYRSAMGMV